MDVKSNYLIKSDIEKKQSTLYPEGAFFDYENTMATYSLDTEHHTIVTID
jgi:phage baseplate assembly protein gpV